MHFVYIIRSIKLPHKIYKGYTTNIEKRIIQHNEGISKYTSKFKPWKLDFYASFTEKEKALDFEKYLKSASGIAFLRKRLITNLNKENKPELKKIIKLNKLKKHISF